MISGSGPGPWRAAATGAGAPPSHYAALAAEVLRRVMVRLHPVGDGVTAPHRGRTVAMLEGALARRGQRQLFRQRVRWAGGLSAAAVAVLASTWLLTHPRAGGGGVGGAPLHADDQGNSLTILGDNLGGRGPGEAVVTAPGPGALPVTRGVTLQPGTGLVAPSGDEIRIGTADGTVLTLEKASELVVGEQTDTRRFSLTRGAVRASVTKLRTGQRFIISTADAEVEVHGTVFRVSLAPAGQACAPGLRTRVSVSEGIVSVRSRHGSEAFVPAGATWPQDCASQPEASAGGAPAKAITADESAQSSRRDLVSRRRSSHRQVVAKEQVAAARRMVAVGDDREAGGSTQSSLALQNDLFAAALRARRQGRIDESVRLFSELVDRYPDGPLAEGAMAQRMKVLADTDAAAARRAAAEYLRNFPAGFAGAEAHRLTGSSP